jgi:hypothetical protein
MPTPAVLIECGRLGSATNTADEHPARFNKGTDCACSSSRKDYNMEASGAG